MSERDGRPELNQILKLLRDSVFMSLRVSLPGRVTRVDRAAGRVDVQPELRLLRVDPELEPDTPPILPSVPVLFPSSTAAAVSFALAEGDPGLLVFNDHSLGTWLLNGELSTPPTREPHGLSGAVFVPGLWPQGDQVPIPEEGAVVEVRGGEALEVLEGEVRAGRGASEAAVKGSSYGAAEASFISGLQAFVTTVSTATTAAQIATAAATFLPFVGAFAPGANSHLATVTKVK